jgi:hypothetical protein
MACRDLLVLIFERVCLAGAGPRGAHEISDLCISFCRPRRRPCARGEVTTRAFPNLLDL